MTTADLGSLIERAAWRAPTALADTMGESSRNYGRLREDAAALASGLARHGVGTGARVVILLANHTEHVTLTAALAWGGAVAVPMNVRASVREIGFVIADSGAAALVYDDLAILPALEAADVDLSGILTIYAGTGARTLSLAEVLESGDRDSARVPLGGADISCILYTSGTTGVPKALAHTNRNVIARIEAWLIHFGTGTAQPMRTLGISPLFHITGLHCAFWTAVYTAGSYHIPVDRSPEGVLELIDEDRLTYLLGAPTLFERWVAAAGPSVLPSVSLIVMGSAPRPAGLVDGLRTTFPAARLAEAYGNTEGVLLGSSDLLGMPGAFHAIGDLDARVVDPEGTVDDLVGDDVIGELIVSTTSERVVSEYLGNPEASAAKYVDGWLRTGDGFRRSADGALYISGRLDDVFISGGENIQPPEVETTLMRAPGVVDIAVTGTPHPEWGEVCTAFVVVENNVVTARLLDRFARDSTDLSAFKRPRRYVFVEEVPRNVLGKILRKDLRSRFIDGDFGAAETL